MTTDPLLHSPVEQEDSVKFSYYWQIFQERKILIFLVSLAWFIVSAAVFFILPNIYEANVQILVEKPGKAQEVYQQLGAPAFTGEEDYYGTQINLLTGRAIIEKVGAEFDLDEKDYKVKAKRIPVSRLISLTITYRDAAKSAAIANRFAELYIQEKNQEELFIPQQLLAMLPDESQIDADTDLGAKLDAVKDASLDFISMVSNDPVVAKLRAQKIDIEAQARENSQRYKWKHPVMMGLNEKLKYVNEQVKQRKKEIVQNLRNSITGRHHLTNVRVLSRAETPKRASYPNRLLGISLGAVVGFIFSLYLSVFLETSNQKIRFREDMENYTDVSFLGSVPYVKEIAVSKHQISKGTIPKEQLPLMEVFKHNSILSDAVASIRTHLLFSVPYEQSKTIMFTSTVPNEGKSSIAALLALSLAGTGRKILLVDADIRRPFLHACLGVKNEKGLREYLEGNATIDEIIQPVPGTSVHVLSAGIPIPNPTEIVISERFGQLLAECQKKYDRIFIDVPPVLYIPDGLILAKHIQSTILVCRSGVVDRKTFQTVKNQFDEMKLKHIVIGAVINGIDMEKEKLRYKYFASYKNYYHSPIQGQKIDKGWTG